MPEISRELYRKIKRIRRQHEKRVAEMDRLDRLWKIILAVAVAFFLFAPFMGCAIIPRCHPTEIIKTADGYIMIPDPCQR